MNRESPQVRAREANTLRGAVGIIKRKARKPDSIIVRAMCRVLLGLARDIEDGRR